MNITPGDKHVPPGDARWSGSRKVSRSNTIRKNGDSTECGFCGIDSKYGHSSDCIRNEQGSFLKKWFSLKIRRVFGGR